MTWRPDLTVAAIVQREESLLDAVVREALEETAWHFQPRHLLGLYQWRNAETGRSFLRVAVSGEVNGHDPQRRLDRGIVATHWLSRDQLLAQSSRLRSPLVLACIDDHLQGRRHDLAALSHLTLTSIARSA
jgi:8-oxo-dGTP pyrophosphatase MutT (NUDIX family)